MIADFLVRGLREQGYAVDLAGDGMEALALAESSIADLIVLDIMLPRLDGMEVCRRIRQAGSKVPILMLTSRDAVEDRVQGLDIGADDYLVKPFAFSELVARVRALARREPALTAPVLRVQDLEMDTTTRRVARHGRQIELTSKEFSLLEYLMKNPDHVLSRTVITERVWDYEASNVANVIDVYIGHLRRKIDDGEQAKLIRTIRGAGYKISSGP